MDEEQEILVRRHWNSHMIGSVKLKHLSGFRMDVISGGVRAPSPYPMLYAYTSCDLVDGEIAHSCRHGSCPHYIKVCIVQKDNGKKIHSQIKAMHGIS